MLSCVPPSTLAGLVAERPSSVLQKRTSLTRSSDPHRWISARFSWVLLVLAIVLLNAQPADAHVLGHESGGFTHGFAHPFLGLDHLLAMVAVGLWAAQIGRPALWVLPVAFPLAMAGGGVIGMSGVELPAVEQGIAGSVAILGLLIALAVRPPLAVSAPLVMLFALLHGYAHGAEIAPGTSPILYGLGFVFATALLHGVGLAVGVLTGRSERQVTLRAGGTALVMAGAIMMIQVWPL